MSYILDIPFIDINDSGCNAFRNDGGNSAPFQYDTMTW